MGRTIKDEVHIAIYAIRYAYTRKTFAPSIVSGWIKTTAWHPEDKKLLVRVLKEEKEKAIVGNWIDKINQPYWDKLVNYLEGKGD